jgi:hypothetical protein
MRQRGVDDRHRERVAQSLPQRDRQREAGKTGPADHDFNPLWHETAFAPCAFLVNLGGA